MLLGEMALDLRARRAAGRGYTGSACAGDDADGFADHDERWRRRETLAVALVLDSQYYTCAGETRSLARKGKRRGDAAATEAPVEVAEQEAPAAAADPASPGKTGLRRGGDATVEEEASAAEHALGPADSGKGTTDEEGKKPRLNKQKRNKTDQTPCPEVKIGEKGTPERKKPNRKKGKKKKNMQKQQLSTKHAGLYDIIWQALALFLPVQTVGVQGGKRTHSHAVILREITGEDGMTADWYRDAAAVMCCCYSAIL